MKFRCVGVLSLLSVLGSVEAAQADPAAAFEPATRNPVFMRIYGNAQPPYGFVRFCDGEPEECSGSTANDARYAATPERLIELDEINRAINKAIEPATDLDVYGVNELWTLPESKGDCEDFALLKRRTLMARGWPASALLLTVVRDEKNEGHAILTARTTQGDFVLDNKTDDVRLWNQTPYQFVMRQSYINPRVWVSLDPTDATNASTVAGVQANPEKE